MNNKLKKILSSTLAVTIAIATMFTTGIVVNATELPNVEKTTNAEGNTIVTQTENPTEYTTVAEKIEEALPEVSAEPVLNANSIEEIDSKDTINDTSDSIFKSCRLIITNPTDLEFKEESLGVDNIVSVQKYEDKYFVTYRSVYATEKAYNVLTALGLDVEIDVVQDAPEGVEIKDDKGNDIESKDIALAEEVRPTKSVEDVVIEDTQKNEKTIVVAVLDTGLNNDEAIFDNKVIEGKNFVSEQSDVKDLDGHGTTMSRIVLDTTEGNVKILPIKVLNDEGKGTTLSAYKGIKYVIEKKKENPSLDFVINLSMSGIGHSKLLEAAINEAYNNNIPVVVSAGNDNKDITEYTPANIDSAFTITSADKNEDKIVKAVYSNYGNEADYTTSGHYEYARNIDDRKVVTKVDGTSVSSAYVSSYIAMLKQMALSDDNEDNNNLSIVDIDTSLSESAIKLEDTTFGKGYLTKENIHFKKVEEVKEVLPIEESSENLDEEIEINKDANTALSLHTRWGNYFAFANYYQNCGFPCKIIWADNNDWAPLDLALSLSDANPMAIWVVGGVGFSGNLTVNGQKVIGQEIGGLSYSPIGLEQDDAIGAAITINGGSRLILEGGEVNARYRGLGRPAIENNGILESYNCHFVCVHNNDTIISNNGTMNLVDSLVTPDISLGGHTTNAITNNNTLTVNNSGIYNDNGLWTGGITNTTWSKNCTINNNSEVSGDTYGVNNNTFGAITIDNSHIWGGVAVSNVAAWNELKINNSDIDGRDTGLKNEAGHPVRLNGSNYIHGNSFGLHQRSGIVYIQNHGNRFSTNNCKSFLQSAVRCEGGTISITGGDFFDAAIALWVEGGSVSLSGGQYRNSNIGIYKNGGTLTINSTNSALIHDNVTGFRLDGENQAVTINNTSIYNNIVGVSNTCTNGTVNVNGSNIYSNWVGINHDANESKPTSTTNLNSGNIYSNPVVCGINVGKGRVNVNGGSVYSNPTGIDNSATLNIKGGSISSNAGFGIDNSGTVTQTGGSIYSNKGSTPEGANGGVLQNGTYNVGAKAEIRPSNSVYLKSGKVINIISNLSTANPIPLTTATDDRTVGRVLVTANSTALANANESKFKLAFAQPVKDSDGAGFSGEKSSGVVRTGSRMPYVDDSKMVLSGIYKVNYNGKRDDVQSIFSYNPSDNFFYWLEPVNEIGLADTSKVVKVTSWEPYEETDLSAEGTGEYEFMGWCEKADGSDTIYKEIRTEWLTKNKPYYAIYRRGKAKVTYNPNGAVDENGNKFGTVTDENSTSIYSDYDLQSGSTFGTLQEEEKYIVVDKKGTNDIVDNAYYKVNKGDITNNLGKKTKMYSFQGWSVVDYADHTAEEILYGGTLPFIDIVSDFNAVLDKGYQTKPNNKTLKSIVNEIKDRSKYYNSGKLVKWNEEFDNNGIVNMYATWDEYPEINAKELVFTERQFNNITEEDLLKKLTATDREDGDITKKVKILNFDDVVKTLNALNTTAATTVTYEVTDSAGNTTRAYAEVWRNSDTPLEISDPEHTAHIRSICRQAYDTHDPKNGGCMKDSLWYNNPEYVQVMLTGFDNMENDTPIKSYTYTKEDRERISAYVDEHGIGNAFEPDALKNYHAIFGTSEYETQNRMDILIDGNDEDSSITILGFEFKWNDKELNQLRKKKDQARIERLRDKIAQASNPQA